MITIQVFTLSLMEYDFRLPEDLFGAHVGVLGRVLAFGPTVAFMNYAPLSIPPRRLGHCLKASAADFDAFGVVVQSRNAKF